MFSSERFYLERMFQNFPSRLATIAALGPITRTSSVVLDIQLWTVGFNKTSPIDIGCSGEHVYPLCGVADQEAHFYFRSKRIRWLQADQKEFDGAGGETHFDFARPARHPGWILGTMGR